MPPAETRAGKGSRRGQSDSLHRRTPVTKPDPTTALAMEVDRQEDLTLVTSEEHGLGATFYEYNEMVLQFGYLAMFAVAFPPASMLALGNNLLEARTDGFKLLYDSKRVKYEGAAGIAPWDTILRTIEMAGVVSNIAVYWLVSPSLRQLNWVVQLIVAGSAALTVYILKALIAALVPDVPSDVKIAVAKERWRVEQKIKWEEKKLREQMGDLSDDGNDDADMDESSDEAPSDSGRETDTESRGAARSPPSSQKRPAVTNDTAEQRRGVQRGVSFEGS